MYDALASYYALTKVDLFIQLVHDIDIGLGLTLDREGMDRILELMGQSGNPQIRSETALLLGNAVSVLSIKVVI